jgi:hypothetical protein
MQSEYEENSGVMTNEPFHRYLQLRSKDDLIHHPRTGFSAESPLRARDSVNHLSLPIMSSGIWPI